MVNNMRHAFLDVNGISTSVLTYGRWVEEPRESTDPEEIILVIPGSPGVTGFYRVFVQILHERTGRPVWVVGYAGFEVPDNGTTSMPPLEGNEHLFGLEGQIEHKKWFFKKYVPPNARVRLIGHSLGAYFILNLLKEESINSKIDDVTLLFPAFENLADTDRCKFLVRIFKPISGFLLFMSWVYTKSPPIVQKLMAGICMLIARIPEVHSEYLHSFLNPTTLAQLSFMMFEEVPKIKERDSEVIRANAHKIKFVYGETDHWAPPSACDKLRNEIPGVKTVILKFDHAFNVRQGREVGYVVADWFNSCK